MSILTEPCIHCFLWVIYAINPAVKLAIASGQEKMQVQMSWTMQTTLDIQGFLFQSTQGGQLLTHSFSQLFFLSSSLLYPNRNSSVTEPQHLCWRWLPSHCACLCSISHLYIWQSTVHSRHGTSPLPFEVLIFIFREDIFCFISCWISLVLS